MRKWLLIIIALFTFWSIHLFSIPHESNTLSITQTEESLRYPTLKILLKDEPLLEALSISQLEEKINLLSSTTNSKPKEWGLHVTGVKNKLMTNENVLALTFDACGSPSGNAIDQDLINFLIANNVPSTLFINKRWIEENKEIFLSLANNPLFQIENHGTDHKPLSVNGQKAYNINGTTTEFEALHEVMENYKTIYQLTGKQPKYYRSGTAHYDEVAVALINELGIEVVNFDINGDAGATSSADKVKHSLLQAQPGSIAILHMNQPNSGTAEGVAMAVPLLREKGFQFVKIEDYQLQ
ncbi:polysaccharide deacetylase family protein [Radiobacillus sp. PE A8.2]|uniref:polysaccharide deacetylase family protein n=1 Tax=Radiobacillus sp. PE A8.2 TaxID=3380349 RepID=UPI00388F4457